MATAEELLSELNRQLKIAEKAKNKIDAIALDVERLSQPDVLKVGDRVQLKENWSVKHDIGSGWRSFVHFMHPENHATIIQVSVYEQRISYNIRFDDQGVPYSLYDKERKGYLDTSVFNFKQNDVRKLDESPRHYRTHEIGDRGEEFEVRHRVWNFTTSAYKDNDGFIYVRSADPISFYAGGRQYLYQPYALDQFYNCFKDGRLGI